MKNAMKIVGFLVVVFIVAVIVIAINKKSKGVLNETEPAALSGAASAFAWRYVPGEDDLDGLPKTVIFVDVTYANGKTVSKKVDEVQGSCNDVDPDAKDYDMVAGTTKIQCYAAGFGEWYKIIKGADSYEVMRKEFAEGSPDFNPPEFPYETVVEIPLTD